MYRIAVIGAGQLGSRHLQGLSLMTVPCEFYLVDPMQAALDVAVQRLSEMPHNDNIQGVFPLKEMAELPPAIDLAVISTTADVRLPLLEVLLAHCKVRYLLLEKILFQDEAAYRRADQLFRSNNVKAWVNCPRRVFDIYGEIKTFLQGRPLHSMQVYGGDWGLGCNGIHFVDLFHFLSGHMIAQYDTRQLDGVLHPSKRRGFVEFSGTLSGKAESTELMLSAVHGSTARHLIMLRADDRSCLVDEQSGQAWFLKEDAGWTTTSFSMPYQSQMTGGVATSILTTGACGLSDYATSAAIHLPFITALRKHISTTDPGVSGCPIT